MSDFTPSKEDPLRELAGKKHALEDFKILITLGRGLREDKKTCLNDDVPTGSVLKPSYWGSGLLGEII